MTLPALRSNIMTTVGFQDQTFKLVSRQELIRHASGITRGIDLGSAIWIGEWTTSVLSNDNAVMFEAMLASLDGVTIPFEAGDLRRPFPRAYPTGAFNDTGLLDTVSSNNKSIRIKSLSPGHIVSVGDYLSFDYGTSRALHQVVEAATADGSGLTPLFEVRPHLRPNFSLNVAVKMKEPKGIFLLQPDSIESRLQGPLHTAISFKAVQEL